MLVDEPGSQGYTRRVRHFVDKWRDEDIVERGVVGHVKWFNLVRGYGFAARNDADKDSTDNDYFVHRVG